MASCSSVSVFALTVGFFDSSCATPQKAANMSTNARVAVTRIVILSAIYQFPYQVRHHRVRSGSWLVFNA